MATFDKVTVERIYNEIEYAATTAAPLFNLYGWTYDNNKVPTLQELRNCITDLAEHALDYFYKSEEEYRSAEVGSGRFAVKVREFDEEVQVKIVLELGEKSWFKAQPKY